MAGATPLDHDPDDAEVREWAKQTSSSIIADNRKKKLTGVIIAVIAAFALGVVFFMKGGSPKTASAPPDSNVTTAARKEVAPLKTDQVVEEVEPIKVATPDTLSVDPLKAQREQMELQRVEKARQLLEARMKSAIDPGGVSGQSNTSGQGSAQTPSMNTAGLDLSGVRGAQDANSRFARAVSGTGVPSSKASRIDNVEFKILQGKIIEAITLPRAISDLPGTLCATVQRDVYAERGRLKLIPWGSRMCGVYSAELRKGQDRIFAVWNALRVSNPDGSISEVALDSIGSDQLGTAGMGGIVDTHFAEIFGTSALLSIIGAGSANAGVSSSDQNNSSAQYRESVQQAAAQTAQSVLAPYVNMPPTVTVPAGSRVRIFVNRDLDFSSLYQDDIDTKKSQAVADVFE